MSGSLQNFQPIQPIAPKGSEAYTPVVDTSPIGPNSYLAQAMADQQLQQLRASQSPQFQFGTLNGLTGQLINPGTGEVMRDANGQQMQSQDSLMNQAAGVRAGQGLNIGQSNDAQMKSDMMGKLSQSILALPESDQHTAYERAIGVLAGKGVVDIHGLPSWEQGGRDFLMKMQESQQQQQTGMLGQQQLMQKYMFDRELPMKQMGVQIGAAEAASKIGLQNAQAGAATLGAQAKAAEVGLNPDGTPGGMGSGKPLTAQDSKALNSATSTLDSISAMRNQLQSGDGSLIATKWPRFAQETTTQKLGDLQNQLSASVGVMIGSNRLSEAQQKIAAELVPTASDLPQTRMDKLDKLETLAQNMSKGIRPYSNTQPGVSPMIQNYQKMYPGMSVQQIQAALNHPSMKQ